MSQEEKEAWVFLKKFFIYLLMAWLAGVSVGFIAGHFYYSPNYAIITVK